jgi:hypothetical protein
MGVAQFTTPTFVLTFAEQDLDLTQADHVYVTFKSLVNKITKSGDDLIVSEKSISVFLSQEETANFRVGTLYIQANWTIQGKRASSDIASYEITDQLLKKVIE